MPITFAHPAAVLPFARRFPLSALVAGSLAPDVAYYLPIPLSGTATHSVLGVLWWDLLIGLVLLLALRFSAGPASILLSSAPSPGAHEAISTVVAVMIGAATHVVWDSFTQTNGVAVQHWDLLRTTVIEPHKTYNVLGYLSSLAGTAIIACLLARRVAVPRTRQHRALAAALLTAPVIGAMLAMDDPITEASTYDLVRHTIVGAVQALASAWAIYAALWHLRAARTRAFARTPLTHGRGGSSRRNRRGP